MSEREDVLKRFGLVQRDGNVWEDHGNGVESRHAPSATVFAMADRIAELENEKRNNVACVKWIAAAFCDEFGNPRGDMPQWAHAVTDTLLLGLTPADAVIRALTPAPRVVVLDEWRVMDKNGDRESYHCDFYYENEAHQQARLEDRDNPDRAPHRVVRVALVEDDNYSAGLNGSPRVVVTEAMHQSFHAIASDLRHVANGGECDPRTLIAHADALLRYTSTVKLEAPADGA